MAVKKPPGRIVRKAKRLGRDFGEFQKSCESLTGKINPLLLEAPNRKEETSEALIELADSIIGFTEDWGPFILKAKYATPGLNLEGKELILTFQKYLELQVIYMNGIIRVSEEKGYLTDEAIKYLMERLTELLAFLKKVQAPQ